MRRSKPAPRPYTSLQDWMERTGTNGRQLLALLREGGYVHPATGNPISAGHLSNILKGSRRCSLRIALALHEVTGVPIRAIVGEDSLRYYRSSLAPNEAGVP